MINGIADSVVSVASQGNRSGIAGPQSFDFTLPDELSAREPAEMRGLARDGVRLMVSHADYDRVTHTRFRSLPRFLSPGDVLVVNATATMNAALDAVRTTARRTDEPVTLHLSTALDDGRWVVELRRQTAEGNKPLLDAHAGEELILPASAIAVLEAPYAGPRLWIASIATQGTVLDLANRHGRPIRYDYVPRQWPLDYYQTVFARVQGSAEMPSAGRPFTPGLLRELQRIGVQIAPILLHTGVSSLEAHEPPYPERFAVPAATADAVNVAHATRHRVVAVGTTSLRALESAALPDGTITATNGWTDLVISPERGIFATDALITGFHAPRASHLALLSALAGPRTIELAYRAALRYRYLWHEFGDSHLLLAR